MRIARCALTGMVLLVLVGVPPRVVAQAAATDEVSAKIWIGRAAEIEEYLKATEIVKMEEVGKGVTRPKRCELPPGGPVAAIAWKPLKPGRYSGFWESYKAEIAAYELDKLLGLDMVPVTVEKRIKGDLGAAIMWATPTKSFSELGGVPTPPPAKFAAWNNQLTIAKMFDNLIYNKDPNLGNWLVDPAWNLILIDHSRAFTTGRDLVHEMTRVDGALWDKMKALDEPGLQAALGEWLSRDEIRAILRRRDRMGEEIDKLVKAKGEAAVIVR